MSKKIVEAAVRRGFLVKSEHGASGQRSLGPLGAEVKRNLINGWMQNVKENRLWFTWKGNSEGDYSALNQAIKHHTTVLQYRPPFCIAFETCNDDQVGDRSEYSFYYVCNSKRTRLSFDKLLRRRQSWWTENSIQIVSQHSKFRYKKSPSDCDEKAIRILPYTVSDDDDPGLDESTGVGKLKSIEILEEIPEMEINSDSKDVSAIRNTLFVQPAVLALLEDGAVETQSGEVEFRLHKRITPHPIALLRRETKNDQTEVVDELCSLVKNTLDNFGTKYFYDVLGDEVKIEDRWKRLKAAGVLYGVVIDEEVLGSGVVKILHSDLDAEVEIALPNLRFELAQRLGHRKGRNLEDVF